MEIKGIRGVGIRRRKPDSQNSEIQESGSWNWPLRLKRQSRAWVALYIRRSCEMHEMMGKRSRFAASVNKTKTTSTHAKGKSRQIKVTKGKLTLEKAGRSSEGRDTGGAAHGHCGRVTEDPEITEWGTRKRKSECGQPKLINAERAVDWKNVRLCSAMFAYVRLIGKKLLRALRGHRRKGNAAAQT